MVDERESPSAGWRTVYDEMGTDTEIEAATHACPDCDRRCKNVCRNVYECPDHGIFRAATSDGESSSAAETGESPTTGGADASDDDGEVETANETDDCAPGRAD